MGNYIYRGYGSVSCLSIMFSHFGQPGPAARHRCHAGHFAEIARWDERAVWPKGPCGGSDPEQVAGG